MAGKESPSSVPQKELNEKCAIFGINGNMDSAARIVAEGLHALQHRGQQGSGISSSSGEEIYSHKRRGLVKQVFDDEGPDFTFDSIPGEIAIGHNRYGTSSKINSYEAHLQPIIDANRQVTFAHNGNLPDTTELEEFLTELGIETNELNDSEMMHATISHYIQRGAPLEEAVFHSIPLFTGAFSFLAMDKETIVAARDKCGIRPFSIGKLNGSYIFSSETCALDVIGATHIRDINPGEIIIADRNGLRSRRFEEGDQKLDIFEFIYFARPDSIILNKNVKEVRKNFGKNLAIEHPVDADIVISVPDSGTPAAIGYAQESGIPYDEGLTKNRYTGRTFIMETQSKRQNAVTTKFNPNREVLRNKVVVVVDDSMVRGTTTKDVIKMIRDAGAREVHMRIAAPPVRNPDHYGIDTPRQSDLAAYNMDIADIQKFISADSLGFLSYAGMISATGLPESVFSTSCFNGIYPIDIGKRREELDVRAA